MSHLNKGGWVVNANNPIRDPLGHPALTFHLKFWFNCHFQPTNASVNFASNCDINQSIRFQSVNKLSSLAPSLSYVALEQHEHTQHKNQFLTAQPYSRPRKRGFPWKFCVGSVEGTKSGVGISALLSSDFTALWAFLAFYLSLIYFFSKILAFLIKLSCDGDWKHNHLISASDSLHLGIWGVDEQQVRFVFSDVHFFFENFFTQTQNSVHDRKWAWTHFNSMRADRGRF